MVGTEFRFIVIVLRLAQEIFSVLYIVLSYEVRLQNSMFNNKSVEYISGDVMNMLCNACFKFSEVPYWTPVHSLF